MPNQLRIAIDATQCLSSHTRGVRRYAINLINGLIHSSTDLHVSVFFNTYRKPKRPIFSIKGSSLEIRISKLPGRVLNWLWRNFSFPSVDLFTGSYDIFHAPSIHQIPPKCSCLICTIHDLVPSKFSEYYSQEYLRYYKKMLELVKRRTRAIITVSQSTKDDIIELLDYDPDGVFVIPEASGLKNPTIIQQTEDDQILSKHRITKPYLLYVGGGERHKNIPQLIEVFIRLKERRMIPHQLVLVGEGLEKSLSHFSLPSVIKVPTDLAFTDYISDEELSTIYGNADVFVFLSEYEGFGLVLLEAMKHGVPIVASNTSSIPEVVKDSALLVSPKDTLAAEDSIMRIVENRELGLELSTKGKMRAAQFSWTATVEQTIEVYRQLASEVLH